MVDPHDAWRTEADPDWLATHRSAAFSRLRRFFHPYLGDAVSHSEAAAFLLSPPRNPPLKVRDIQGEAVRYAEQQYAYTTVRVELAVCRLCGARVEENHRVVFVSADGQRTQVGAVRRCRNCAKESWLFHSNMPATRRARERDRKVVL